MTAAAATTPGPGPTAAGPPRRWVRAGTPVLLVAALYAVVVVTLLSPPRRPPAESPLVPETAKWPSHPVRLLDGATTGDVHVHRLRLFTARPDVANLSEIRLFLATYKTKPHLLSAQLSVAGTPCTYTTLPETKLEDNHLVTFVPGKGCSRIAGPISGNLELAVRIKGPGEVAVWTFVPPAGAAQPGWIVVSEPGTAVGGVRPVVRGSCFDTPPRTTLSRADLLSYMWQLSARPTWIWLALLASFALTLTGALTFPMRRLPELPQRARTRSALNAGLGAFCFATAVAVAYAVLVPPLMAPDEPFHLMGFGALNGNAKIASETAKWTQVTHLDRIRFHGNDHFRPEDIGKPWPVSDPYLGATEVRVRSGTATAYWRLLGHLFPDRSPQQTLLVMRLSNALVFGLAVGAATVLGIVLTSAAYAQLLCFPFLFVPTLPFFAMMVSDYSVLCAAYVLLAASVSVMVLDGPRAHWAGIPLGVATAVMMAANRSSLPMTAVVAVALLARVLLGTRGVRRPLRTALLFWLGFGIGASAIALLVEKAFLATIVGQIRAVAPGAAGDLLVAVLTRPGLLILAAAVMALVEIAVHAGRRQPVKVIGRRLAVPAMIASGALAAAVLASLLGSLAAKPPHVPMIQAPDAQAFVPNPPSRQAYVKDVLATALTVFRLREPDLFLYTSFMGGFGWIDTVPPAAFLIGLAVATGLALAALAAQLALLRSVRRTLWLYAFLAGSLAAVALYAVTAYALPVNLHGRYLIGWYLCWLAVAWGSLACVGAMPERLRHRFGVLQRIPRPAPALAFCGLIHAYCLHFILARYF